MRAKGASVISDKVQPNNLWAWSAFQALRGSRQYGMTAGPIPISEIHAYCNLIGVSDIVQRYRLTRFVMALDRAERKYYGDTQSKS